MEQSQWAVLAVTALLIDFSIGLAIGYLWRASTEKPAPAKPTRDVSAVILSRIDELLVEVRGVVACTDDHVGRLQQVRRTIDEAPGGGKMPDFSLVARTIEQFAGEMAAIQQKLRQRFRLSQEAATAVRRACEDSMTLGDQAAEPAEQAPSAVSAGDAAEPTATMAADSSSGLATNSAGTADEAPEHRREDRHAYRAAQRMACYTPGRIPQPEEFQLVQCCDLSSGGVSFMIAECPQSELVVITIGHDDDIAYRTARVANAVEVEGPSGTMYRVGCKFIGRLSPHLF